MIIFHHYVSITTTILSIPKNIYNITIVLNAFNGCFRSSLLLRHHYASIPTTTLSIPKNINNITMELASQISLDSDFLKEHFLYLSYNLGAKEKEGLREYFRYAEKFKIIDKIPELKFLKLS